ncbi:MAG: M28 family peptidase [Candidatus Dormibacteria bacterium]
MRAFVISVVAILVFLAPVSVRAQTSSDLPVPDLAYQYQQLYDMSTNYLQRYSGQDGPPGDLNTADGNLPPQVNGWQEFFAHWKEQVVSPAVMGGFAQNLHVDDHLFRAPSASFFGPPPPYDSNVASVTIPGAQCPGQTVLVASHPDSTPALNIANGSSYDDTSGVTMGMAELQALTRWWTAHHTWPARTFRVALFDAEEEGLYGSQYYAANLLPQGPQGNIALVANMDQNGMEYPAHPGGTTKSTFGPGFWYTNINSSPIKDFSIYRTDGKPGPAPPPFAANMPAILHFRAALADAVSQTFATLGQKYGFQVPLENPLENGATVPAYRPADIAKYSPVQDDTLGRTDQVPFIAAGIPGYGIVGAYDSNPKDNPLGFPATPLTPLGASGLPQIAGYDTPRDNMTHLNLMASGTTGGGTGQTESVELRRALELPMTWTLNLLSRPEYVGGVTAPGGPVAYFEALPVKPKPGDLVTFNGAETAANGATNLNYSWDFGDGTKASGQVVKHSYTAAGWYDAKLAVRDGSGHLSGYRQAVPVGSPKSAAPVSDACGTLAASELTSVTGPGGSGGTGGTPNTAAAVPQTPAVVLLVLVVLGSTMAGWRWRWAHSRT